MMETLLANPVLMGLAGVIGGCVLLAPSIIALARSTDRRNQIASLNAVVLLPGVGILFNGWLLPIGILVWLWCLVWAIVDRNTTVVQQSLGGDSGKAADGLTGAPQG